jgi:hypothetical protein
MIHDSRGDEPEKPAAAADRTLASILAGASADTRATIAVLGEILGQRPAASLSPAAFASEHLGVDTTHLATTSYAGPGASLAILGNLLRIEIERHADRVVIGSPGDGLPPTWSQLDLGPDEHVAVPSRMVVFFPAGTLAAVPLCVRTDDRHWAREFSIMGTLDTKPVADEMLRRFCERLKTPENPMLGRVLEATVQDGCLKLGITPVLSNTRDGLVLPPEVWREVDLFVAAATTRRELLRRLGLGTNRGMLVAGPPGVGKTHLVRVIAAELRGRFTTLLADAGSMRHMIADLYATSETFGPTLVVLDDIDLVLGHRSSNGDNDALADFLSTLDGVLERSDVLTIATTNDPQALDPAAQRSSRFDMTITLPLPDEPSRMRILEAHLAGLGLPIDYTAAARALEGATGADVKEAVRRAVLEHGESFTTAQLVEVAESGRWRVGANRRRYLA